MSKINKEKSNVLSERLKSISSGIEVTIYSKDILEVSNQISDRLKSKTISYIVIDPKGFEGMTWEALDPLLKCKGDAMVTWFEDGFWRMRGVALSDASQAEENAKRLTDLLGSEEWRGATEASEITEIFINRVLTECSKKAFAKVEIPRPQNNPFIMILELFFNCS